MEINFRRLGIALLHANIVGLFLVPCNLIAQGDPKSEEIKGQVVLSKLFTPNYPPLAREFRIFGEVHLRVSIHSDGRVNSVTVIDGPPMLRQTALDSARQSHFDCEHCEGSELMERTFTYSFQISGQKPVDSGCCWEEKAPPDEPPTESVSQSDERIGITTRARCECSAEYLGTLMDRRMRLIAGNDAMDCGRVKLNGDPRASLRCARQAISKKRAFFVRLDSTGIDSFLSDGFAGDSSGNVYSVSFDSLGYGPSPGIEILDNSHDAVEVCPKPVRIKARRALKGSFFGYRCTPEEN